MIKSISVEKHRNFLYKGSYERISKFRGMDPERIYEDKNQSDSFVLCYKNGRRINKNKNNLMPIHKKNIDSSFQLLKESDSMEEQIYKLKKVRDDLIKLKFNLVKEIQGYRSIQDLQSAGNQITPNASINTARFSKEKY